MGALSGSLHLEKATLHLSSLWFIPKSPWPTSGIERAPQRRVSWGVRDRGGSLHRPQRATALMAFCRRVTRTHVLSWRPASLPAVVKGHSPGARGLLSSQRHPQRLPGTPPGSLGPQTVHSQGKIPKFQRIGVGNPVSLLALKTSMPLVWELAVWRLRRQERSRR